jgi:hypothetical protein
MNENTGFLRIMIFVNFQPWPTINECLLSQENKFAYQKNFFSKSLDADR